MNELTVDNCWRKALTFRNDRQNVHSIIHFIDFFHSVRSIQCVHSSIYLMYSFHFIPFISFFAFLSFISSASISFISFIHVVFTKIIRRVIHHHIPLKNFWCIRRIWKGRWVSLGCLIGFCCIFLNVVCIFVDASNVFGKSKDTKNDCVSPLTGSKQPETIPF